MQVRVFSPGDHGQHRDDPDPKDTQELVKFLLSKAGYTKDLTWEVRIEKMRTASNTAPPIRVMEHKPFGVVMRVKPAPNNVEHVVTLLIPDSSGYSASNLCTQLKGVERNIKQNWKQQIREEKREKERDKSPAVPQTIMQIPLAERREEKREEEVINTPAHATPRYSSVPLAPPPPPAPIPQPKAGAHHVNNNSGGASAETTKKLVFEDLQGVCKEPEKRRYFLQGVYETNQEGVRGKSEYLIALRRRLGWHKFHVRTVGRVVSEFIKHDYLIEHVGSDNRIIGYDLTRQGCQQIGKPGGVDLDSPEGSVILSHREAMRAKKRPQEEERQDREPQQRQEPPPPSHEDLVRLLSANQSKVQSLSAACVRLASNSQRRAELLEELRRLDEQDAEIVKVISLSRDSVDSLTKLMGFVSQGT